MRPCLMQPANHTKTKRVAIVYSVCLSAAGPAKRRRNRRPARRGRRRRRRKPAGPGRRCSVRDSVPDIRARLRRLRPAALVNLCEGFRGRPEYEAHLAGLWELLIPFTGNGARALQLCRDKFQTKLPLRAAGVNVPDGWAGCRRRGCCDGRWPLIVKPAAEDGGIGIYRHSVVRRRTDLAVQIRRVARRYAPAGAGGAIH